MANKSTVDSNGFGDAGVGEKTQKVLTQLDKMKKSSGAGSMGQPVPGGHPKQGKK